jgi:hypothetical protein
MSTNKEPKIKSAYDLVLPDSPGFISEPPIYNFADIFKLCEQMLPETNKARLAKPIPKYNGGAFSF